MYFTDLKEKIIFIPVCYKKPFRQLCQMLSGGGWKLKRSKITRLQGKNSLNKLIIVFTKTANVQKGHKIPFRPIYKEKWIQPSYTLKEKKEEKNPSVLYLFKVQEV